MLESLELENFKAFGRRTKIPLAPITLVFGENSAGKSSILQALHLLKQTLESRDENALLVPRAEDGILDLGSFNELIYDHDGNRPLSIRLDIRRDNFDDTEWEKLGQLFGSEFDKTAMEFTFIRPDTESEVYLQSIKCFSANIGNSPLAIYESIQPFSSQNVDVDGRKRRRLRCTHLTANPEFWEKDYNLRKRYAEKLVAQWEHGIKDLKKDLETDMEPGEDYPEFMREYIGLRERALELYRQDFSLEQFVGYMKSLYTEELAEIKTVKFLPASHGDISLEDPVVDLRFKLGQLRREKPNELADITGKGVFIDRRDVPILMGKILAKHLRTIFPMGPVRKSPQRYYIFTGSVPQDVGYQGGSMPGFLYSNSDQLKKVNEWLIDEEKLDIGYKLKAGSVGDANDLFELRLVDVRRKGDEVDVGLPDVGFGISQLLPFIVQALTSTGQIISIEQPEVHVHPRLQADLGDLLAEGIKEQKNQFLIETHSEHLVLRLQRLIRYKELEPSDVAILYVCRTSEGSSVKRLNVDEDGFFVDEWPGGFFPERLKELV